MILRNPLKWRFLLLSEIKYQNMKTIKRIGILLSAAVILLSVSACECWFAFYSFGFKNNSASELYLKYPVYPERWQYGFYPDTTIRFTLYTSIIPVNFVASEKTTCKTIEGWFSKFPNDTVSLFIFDAEVVESNSWEKVVDEYLVLQRYDLSIEDFKKLGSLIPYPPTPEMKDMHMYPPYGE